MRYQPYVKGEPRRGENWPLLSNFILRHPEGLSSKKACFGKIQGQYKSLDIRQKAKNSKAGSKHYTDRSPVLNPQVLVLGQAQ